MQTGKGNKGTLVTGVIGDDVHNVGIRVLEHALRNAGFKVVALGIQVSQEEFINAAIETKADAILVSSLSGHARLLATGFRDKCIEAGMTDILLYLGGQLVIGENKWTDTDNMFRKMGFDRVYPPLVSPETVIVNLEADLRNKNTG
jgi:methylaspartate mutase sigma subunit